MKKLMPFLCILIALSSVFVFFAYARQGDKPSEVTINNALFWAESLEGETKFPYSDGTGDYISWLNCTNFVANAYGTPSLYQLTAGVFWAYTNQHPGDWNAPKGSLVFFSPTEQNNGYGHVALSTGNGNLIEAGYTSIMNGTISEENIHGAYLGWSWPPDDWPGRCDNIIATAYTWAIQIAKAVILTFAAWGIFLLVKTIIFKKSRKKDESKIASSK